MKISGFEGIEDGNDESLLMVSYTDDGGQTFKSRKIRLEDFIDDFDVENLANVDGEPTESQVLQFSSGTWSPEDVSDVVPTPALGDLSDVDVNGVQENQIIQWDGTTWVAVDFANASLSNIAYEFKNNRSTNPGEGNFTINGWTPSGTNLVFIDPISNSGRDISEFVNTFVKPGQTLLIEQDGNPNSYAEFLIAGAPIPNSVSIAIPVTHQNSTPLVNRSLYTFKFKLPVTELWNAVFDSYLEIQDLKARLEAAEID